MIQFFLLFGVVVLTSGCATNLYLPGNRMLTPESSGEVLSGSFEIGRAGVTQVQVASDFTASSPDTTPELIENSALSMGFQLGLASPLDFYYHSSSGGPNFWGMKLQVLGASQKEAKAGGYSLALAGAMAMGELKSESTSNGVKGTSQVTYGGWEALVLAGYRSSAKSLFYVSPFYSQITADVKLQREVGGVTATTAEPNGEGVMQGISLGARFGGTTYLNLEVSQTQTEWTRKDPTESAVGPMNDTAWGAWVGTSW